MEIKENKKLKGERVVESSSPVANHHNALGTLRGFREVPPAHYIFKIQSFSLLLFSKTEIYESRPFEEGGYKWKLTLYPNGNKKMNVHGHVSLYLTIVDTEKLPVGWEVNASFKLFVFNTIRDKYLTIQLGNPHPLWNVYVDAEGGIRRFHRMKSEWGFDKFLPLDILNDASNGYLHDDCCVFGAEVFVIKHTGKGECFSMIKNPVNNKYLWKIKKISEMKEEEICSDEFVVGDHKWKLLFFPNGIGNVKGERVSLFLKFNDLGILFPEQRVYAEFKLRIRHQHFSVTGIHVEKEGNAWFSASSPECGFGDFLSRSHLHNASSKGYIVNDTVIVEAEITLISSFKDF